MPVNAQGMRIDPAPSLPTCRGPTPAAQAAAAPALLPPGVRDAWWEGTTRQWPFMAADLGCSMETVMAHYMSNHVAVAYGDGFGEMVAASQALGFRVRVLAK